MVLTVDNGDGLWYNHMHQQSKSFQKIGIWKVMIVNRIWKGALVSFIMLMICWFGLNISDLEMIRALTSTYLAILFVGFLFTGVVTKIGKNISPYFVFAAVNFLIGAGTAIYSIYDIKTDTDEWFGGLVGTLLLVFVIPFIVVLLISALVAWKINRSKQ